MSFSVNGKSKDLEKLTKKIADAAHCPVGVKAIIHDAVMSFPNGATVEFNASGHYNDDGSGGFTLNVNADDVPVVSTTDESAVTETKSVSQKGAGKDSSG